MKKHCLIFICIFAFNLIGADSNSSGKTRFLLVGNPGVGKSTLINTFLGDAKCKSGLSAGAGPITTVRDVLSEEEFLKLFDATKLTVNYVEQQSHIKQNYSNWSLVHPAWKTPDGVSFPDFLVVSQLLREPDGKISVKGFTRLALNLKGLNIKKNDDSYFLFFSQIKPPYKQVTLTIDLGIQASL
jgi:energy-coupling factor transporter ATP-binding protein EcfA2